MKVFFFFLFLLDIHYRHGDRVTLKLDCSVLLILIGRVHIEEMRPIKCPYQIQLFSDWLALLMAIQGISSLQGY